MGEMKGEMRFVFPEVLAKAFIAEPRVLLKWRPDGLWPVDPAILLRTGLLEELAVNEQFKEQFEIVIMPR